MNVADGGRGDRSSKTPVVSTFLECKLIVMVWCM